MKDVADGNKWQGNRELQKALERRLAELGIKADGISASGSGGRTWAALARTFGYWYPDADGFARITPVGEALLRSERIRAHIQKQILCFQLPNGYVNSSDFRPAYCEGYRVFPFRFILRLLLDSETDGFLMRDEIALLLLKVKRDEEYVSVKEEIRHFRRLQQSDGLVIADRGDLVSVVSGAYDHRERRDTQAVSFLAYARDSALTHMIILRALNPDWFEQADGLLRLLPEAADEARECLAFFDDSYPFDTRYKISSELFSRHYGLDLSRRKNNFPHNGRLVASNGRKQSQQVKAILTEILAERPTVSPSELLSLIDEPTGLGRRQIERELDALGMLDPTFKALSAEFIDNYLDAATDWNRWRDFERLTAEVFTQLGLSVRPLGEGGETIELKLRLRLPTGQPVGGIVDCKSGGHYRLSVDHRDKMATSYLPSFNHMSWPDDHNDTKTGFFGYVVGDQFSGKANFEKIASKALQHDHKVGHVSGFVLNAKCILTLLEKRLQNEVGPAELHSVLTSNRVFLVPHELERFLSELSV